ncbi:MAG: purine-nucleoside phosphorylase [Bacteroidales bacterium]|nr:purine-nucleoside phosphorylase [Bacteroidales bacterium]
MLRKIKESVTYITKHFNVKPIAGVILGTGLGSFVSEVSVENEIPYYDIPHFPDPGVEGHIGKLLLARHHKIPVVIMQGRVHYYEGFPIETVIYPIRVLKELGIETLFLSNAAGGMNAEFSVGDLMVIKDHINLMPNPLIGPNINELGPRFVDMSEPYDKALIDTAFDIAKKMDIRLRKGCYVGTTGPTYETAAEYKYLRTIGGDAVGMSTVPEVIVARQMGLRCFAMSVITDLGVPGKIERLTHQMIQQVASASEPRMALVFKHLIASLAE